MLVTDVVPQDGNLTRDMLDHESGYFLSTPGHVCVRNDCVCQGRCHRRCV